MAYASELIGNRVYDTDGRQVGRVIDMVVGPGPTPAILRLRVRTPGGLCRVGWSDVTGLDPVTVRRDRLEALTEAAPDETLLSADVLDKQIVDTQGFKVRRVNDVRLEKSGDLLTVAAVDIGLRGFTRRVGGRGLLRLMDFIRRRPWTDTEIPWAFVQPLGGSGSALRLTRPWRELAKLHPADLADIVDGLDRHEQMALFSHLDDEQAAETLTNVEEASVQEDILDDLGAERASDIIEEMPPDEAADILGDLPKHKADKLLDGMEKEEAAEVKELLEFHEETAGGLMTTEYVALPDAKTCGETIEQLRRTAPEAEVIYYLYVVDAAEKLLGVMSLRDLIVSPPATPVGQVMKHPAISVHVNDHQNEVVEVMAKYDFLAVPVVDDSGVLRGVVTVDDVMDVALEAARPLRRWRR
ncbi:MAG: magnesium transporter MgtE N-terminal domain-containing protein [Bacillota bacterium]